MVKNSLARRATEGTPLAPAFDESEGSLAVIWGGEDFVSLAKELVALHKKPEFEKFTAKGGVMEGERLTAEKVTEVSKWPNRAGTNQHRTGPDSLARLEAAVANHWPRRQAAEPDQEEVGRRGSAKRRLSEPLKI